MGGYVDPFIRRRYIKTTANTACSFPERRTKMLIRLTGPVPLVRGRGWCTNGPRRCTRSTTPQKAVWPRPRRRRRRRRPATRTLPGPGDGELPLLRWGWRIGRCCVRPNVTRARRRPRWWRWRRQRSIPGPPPVSHAPSAAPHTQTLSVTRSRVLYIRVPVTGVQRAIVSRYTTHPHTRAITQHTQCGARAQRKR